MWKSIVGAWLNVKLGLIKSDPSNLDEVLRQPLFGNPSILNANGTPLGVGRVNEGNVFAQSGYSWVKDIWNVEAKDWKGLTDLGMKHHPTNRRGMETIKTSIPWRKRDVQKRWAKGSHPRRRLARQLITQSEQPTWVGLPCPRANRRHCLSPWIPKDYAWRSHPSDDKPSHKNPHNQASPNQSSLSREARGHSQNCKRASRSR